MSKPKVIQETITLGDGKKITIETGVLAKQADGAVMVRMGDTMLLATVVSAAPERPLVSAESWCRSALPLAAHHFSQY